MPSIRLTQFAGLMPELSAKLKRKDNAQIAHNCLLYDGRLQAMPAYFKYQDLTDVPSSMIRTSQNGVGSVAPVFGIQEAIYTENPPFLQSTLGISPDSPETGNNFISIIPGVAGTATSILPAGVDPPLFAFGGLPRVILIAAGHQTPRPECVAYAVTTFRKNNNSIEESIPILLGVVGNGILSDPSSISTQWHEGDAVQLTFSYLPLISGQTGFRLYRTVTAIETGEQLINTFDTDWNLVDVITANPAGGNFTYTDNALTQNLPGTLLLSRTFLSPYYTTQPIRFGLTESGWPWFATSFEIQFAERYMAHAWPMQNYLQVTKSDQIHDARPFYDNVFLGTSGRPYRVHISTSDDDAVEINTYPFPENQPCIPNSLVTAPFGALYTSVNGIIALEENRMQVITRDLLNSGSKLYTHCVGGAEEPFYFADIEYAAWFNGWYIGYNGQGQIFVYEPPEDLNDKHAFQQLITMDAPSGVIPSCWAIGDYGLQIAFGTSLYYWPVPGWVRPLDTPTKLCYRWKSKKFVFPGLTTFAAAKVVWECDGEVCFKLIGDCKVVYERKVANCQPFRLPHNYRHIEWEIEVTGTGTISEIHVASSMQELTEVSNE